MKLDRTLIDKDGAPSEEEMREFFLKHDYTVHKSSFDPMKASEEDLMLYKKAKDFFKESWLSQLSVMGGKGSMKNFTKNYPLCVLEDANEDLISGTVVEILSDDDLTEKIFDSFFSAMEEPLTAGFNAYAKTLKKEPTALSETEIKEVVDKLVDLYLAEMMNLYMKSQGVPELVKTVKKNGTHEDFNNDVRNNYDKIDFDRKWYHLRTKLGAPLSLDELFGNETVTMADISGRIVKLIHNTEAKERFNVTRDIGWQIERGLFNCRMEIGKRYDPNEIKNQKNASYILDDNGFTIVSNGKEPFFSVFPQPAEGYGHFLNDKDDLQKIFAALSHTDTMNALIYLYQKTRTTFLRAQFSSEIARSQMIRSTR